MDDREARELAGALEARLDDADDAATDLVAMVLALYGEGLARMVALMPDPSALIGDEVVSHLLLLHGLHPVPIETRVQAALDEVRPYLDSHGGDVELLGVSDGVAHLRLEGTCNGCPSSAMTLKGAIEKAIHEAAPEIDAVEADGETAPAPGMVELPMVCEIPTVRAG